MISLDEAFRPTWLFGQTVHEGCDRGGYYEQAQFGERYGSRECIVMPAIRRTCLSRGGGGVALLIAGAGLIMAHPVVRRQVQVLGRVVPGVPESLSGSLATVVPDFQRCI